MFFPTVTVFRSTILIPVYVDPAEKLVYAGSFILPKGCWQLVWTLCTLPGGNAAFKVVFAENEGVKLIHALTEGAVAFKSSQRTSATQWIVDLDNQVKDPGGVLQYDLAFTKEEGADLFKARFVHDPTIFVSKDPIDPPV